MTAGGGWAAADLTALTPGTPPAAAGSPLSGYEWAAGQSKHVVYLDGAGHVRELSVSVGGSWAAADLTALAGAGSALSGYQGPRDTGNLLVHGCLWSPESSGQGAVVVQPTTVYPDAASLLALPADQGLFEQWRVGDHGRANPLMGSGQLMVCLAVETWLGVPGSKDILARLLATTKSLFKYTNSPWDGYILRWDPATSDHWVTGWGENGIWPVTCGDFLTDPDNPGQFLYCTPLDDPRYVAYMPQGKFENLPSGNARNSYQNLRRLSLDRTRYWEPSMDELTGLVAGYSFVSAIVSDPGIQAEVSDQVGRLARYLSANSYLLVRPGGGFVAQGGSGIAPALEFPFGRVFSRITGSAYPAQTDFEGALRNAKLWSQFSDAFAAASVGGAVAGALLALLLTYLGALLGGVLGAVITELGGIDTFISIVAGGAIAKAWVLQQDKESFDVYSWPGDSNSSPRHDDQQGEFAMAYLLRQISPAQRFTATMAGLAAIPTLQGIGLHAGGYSENFPPFLGLTALNDADHTVRDAYLGWLAACRAAGAANNDPFASAVAVILGAGQAEQQKLASLLGQDTFLELINDQLGWYGNNILYVTESVQPALGFMSALALAWYYSKTQADAGTPLPASLGFPAPPPAGTALPPATIPAAVINAGYGDLPGQVIPTGALPPLPNPLPSEIDLFAASAPGKPNAVAGNVPTVTWLYSGAATHYGTPWGDSGTDTIGAGKTVTGSGCTILGVKLQIVDQHGNPLGDVGTSTAQAAPETEFGVWPSADAANGWPFSAGARIQSIGAGAANPADETVIVQWWYDAGRACRYRIAYLVQGSNPAL